MLFLGRNNRILRKGAENKLYFSREENKFLYLSFRLPRNDDDGSQFSCGNVARSRGDYGGRSRRAI